MNGIDGIICNNELTAIAMMGGLQEADQKLGTNYELVCKQTTEILPLLYPQLDTIAEDLYATGKQLAELLVQSINGAPPDALQVLQKPIANWARG